MSASVTLGNLRSAVGTDLGEARQRWSVVRLGVVAAAKGSVADGLAVARPHCCGDVPDVFVGAAQAERFLGLEFFRHRAESTSMRDHSTCCAGIHFVAAATSLRAHPKGEIRPWVPAKKYISQNIENRRFKPKRILGKAHT